MKRALAALAAVVVGSFAFIAWLHRHPAEDAGSDARAGDPARQRIKTFWTLYNRANTDRVAGRFEQAAAGFRECLKLDPKHEDSLYNLGTSLKEVGEYREAAAAYRRLIEVNPESNRAWSELGNTLSTPAPGAPIDYEEARGAFAQSIRINREQAGPFLQLGKLELNAGNRKAALEQFKIAAGFQSPEGNYLAGYALFLEKKYLAAAGCFRKVLDSQARERRITGRGVLSEGDILPAEGKPMTALEKSSLKALLLLYWCSRFLGGYPPGTPKEFQHVDTNAGAPPDVAAKARAAMSSAATSLDRCPESLRRGTLVDCVVADFNSDGKPDLFLLHWRKDAVLYWNQGDGTYKDGTQQAGLSGIRSPSYSAVALDYDKDGRLDLFVSVNAPFEEAARSLLQPSLRATRFTPRLFRNQGGGRFEEVSAQAGLTRNFGTRRAIAGDFNSDGWPDVLLVNSSPEPSVLLTSESARTFRHRVIGLTPGP